MSWYFSGPKSHLWVQVRLTLTSLRSSATNKPLITSFPRIGWRAEGGKNRKTLTVLAVAYLGGW